MACRRPGEGEKKAQKEYARPTTSATLFVLRQVTAFPPSCFTSEIIYSLLTCASSQKAISRHFPRHRTI